jgi:ribosomal protein L10
MAYSDDAFIADVTGLTLEQIKDVRANLSEK